MKRFLIITIVSLAVLVSGLCGTLILGSNCAAVHRLVISRINAAIPGNLTLGRLQISFLNMRLDIHHLCLADSSGKVHLLADVGGDPGNPRAAVAVHADELAVRAVRLGSVALDAELEKNGTAAAPPCCSRASRRG